MALSLAVANLLKVMSKGVGATSVVDTALLRDTLAALAWGVTEKRIWVLVQDATKFKNTRFGEVLQGQKIVIDDFKLVCKSAEQAQRLVQNFPTFVGSPPSNGDIGDVCVKRVGVPQGQSDGNWVIHLYDVSVLSNSYTFRTDRGVSSKPIVLTWARYETPDESKARLPGFWSWGYKNGLQERAQSMLAGSETETQPLGARDLKDLGTCPVCMQSVRLTGKQQVMRHGWSVVGTRGLGSYGSSWHSESCFGVGYSPWETSPVGATDYLAHLVGKVKPSLEKEVQRWSAPSPPEIPNSKFGTFYNYFGGVRSFSSDPKVDDLAPPKIGYNTPERVQQYREQMKQDIVDEYWARVQKEITNLNAQMDELTSEANSVQTRIQVWRPKVHASVSRVARQWLQSKPRL